MDIPAGLVERRSGAFGIRTTKRTRKSKSNQQLTLEMYLKARTIGQRCFIQRRLRHLEFISSDFSGQVQRGLGVIVCETVLPYSFQTPSEVTNTDKPHQEVLRTVVRDSICVDESQIVKTAKQTEAILRAFESLQVWMRQN
jgi:hypothetical protein